MRMRSTSLYELWIRIKQFTVLFRSCFLIRAKTHLKCIIAPIYHFYVAYINLPYSLYIKLDNDLIPWNTAKYTV